MARTLAAAGARRDDIVHNAYGYGLFTGGLGVHYGAERLGASVIPVSGGNTKRQIMLMKDFGPTVLTCTPSYALHLAEVAEEMGVDFARPQAQGGHLRGRALVREHAPGDRDARSTSNALDIYGLSEIIGPGVAIECLEAKNGLHIFEDHFLPEIINPDTGAVLPDGTTGELVFTTLTKEAFPLLRYRTRDITVAEPRALPLRPHHRPHGPHPGPQRRHAHHPRRQRLPVPDRERAHGDPGTSSRTTSSWWTATATWTRWRCQVEVNEAIFSDEIKKLQALERRASSGTSSEYPRRLRQGQAGGAQEHPPQRRQGQAGHRQAQNLDFVIRPFSKGGRALGVLKSASFHVETGT